MEEKVSLDKLANLFGQYLDEQINASAGDSIRCLLGAIFENNLCFADQIEFLKGVNQFIENNK